MKLKSKKNKGKYKSIDAWIDAIYRNNKILIDEKLLGAGTLSTRTRFKNLVKSYFERGYTPTQAINKLANSTIFTPEVEKFKFNAYEGLKKDKAAYKKFRELTKVNGKYTKIDFSKFRYDKYEKIYYYDERISIIFKNSPYEVIVGV